MNDFDHKKLTLENSILLGSTVVIKGTNLSGTLLKLEKNGTGHIEVNGKVLKLNINKISLKKETRKKKERNSTLPANSSRSDASISVDLHGMTKEQAWECLVSFLDKALLQNVGKIEIIHGHGNGILKKEVHKFLSESKHIASFKLLEYNTGTTCGFLK